MEKQINVIIADDSPAAIEGIIVMLSRKKKFRIIDTCRNGKELVTNTNLSEADLLLIDIDMPILNGLEAALQIKKNHPDLPMIAISMHVEWEYIEDFIFAGYKGFIPKPQIPLMLFGTIDMVLEGKEVFPDRKT
ncbi:MAG: response regulator transcription factor [Bacteroidales bacterium]|nr:response regulator transcription factor [Bacteroidales bacterium]MCF8404685.1 response regulator transcription factor [Bacteroidales bacterium]